MKLNEFRAYLNSAPDRQLSFALPDGGQIEAHAHITEVGRIEKRFIDCGGTVRSAIHCSLQAWVANDTDHRLSPARLASIIELAAPVLGADDLDVEIEYQDGLISQFPVVAAEDDGEVLRFHLATKNTDCLAKDVCGIPTEGSVSEGESCCAGSGCC